jgi:hypothetical protein
MSWCLNKPQSRIVYQNTDKKSVTKKYSRESIWDDFAHLEEKVGIMCPEDRKRELIGQVESEAETTSATETNYSLYSFPAGTVIPAYLSKCSVAGECSLILQLGVETKLKMDEIAKNSLLESLIEEKEIQTNIAITHLRKELMDKYSADIGVYQAQVEQCRKQIRDSRETFLLQKDTEVSELIKKLQNMESVKQENSQLQEMLRTSRQMFQDEFTNIRKTIQNEYETKSTMLEASLVELKEEKKELSSQLSALLQTRGNSSKLGQQGEFNLEYILQSVFPESNIETVESHCGDFIQSYRNLKIMWEAKNHHTSVPKRDVDKFLRDMKNNTDIDVGVMVAMNTHIEAHNCNNGLDFEFLNDVDSKPYRCVFYISNLLAYENPTFILRFINVFLLHIQRAKPTMAGNDKLNVFGMKIQKLVGIVNGRLKTWKKRKMELSKELEENTVFIEEMHSGLCELAGDM